MAGVLSQEAQELLRFLSDGEWHDYEETLESVGARIAPGRALRKAEERIANYDKQSGGRKSPPPPQDVKIRQGRRTLMIGTMNSMGKRYIEFEVDDLHQRQRVRRRAETIPSKVHAFAELPGEKSAPVEPVGTSGVPCPQCGLAVLDAERHKSFHDYTHTQARTLEVFLRSVSELMEMSEVLLKALPEVATREFVRHLFIERFAALEQMLDVRIRKPGQRNRTL